MTVTNEDEFDCEACLACCCAERDAWSWVWLTDHDLKRFTSEQRKEFTERERLESSFNFNRRMKMLPLAQERKPEAARTLKLVCAALEGNVGELGKCRIYGDRPSTCREFEKGGENCIKARKRAGLPV